MKNDLIIFEDYKIRRLYDEETQKWYFSLIDIIQVLTQQPDFQTARNYWKVVKNRLNKEGNQSVTKCNRLKLEAADGKKYLTDVADTETILRIIQSVPSPKAEPIKLWLAKVGYERIQEMTDPERSLDRARETWAKHGRSEKWIQQRMKYCRSGIPLLSNLSGFYREAPVKIKQKLLGSIFSAKLHFREDSYRTTPLNAALALILQKNKGLENEKTGQTLFYETLSD